MYNQLLQLIKLRVQIFIQFKINKPVFKINHSIESF